MSYIQQTKINAEPSSPLHVVYLDSKMTHMGKMTTSYCVKHQLITPSNAITHTHKAIQTYALFVHGQRDTRFKHSTNEDQRRAVIAIVVHLDSKMAHA